MNSELVHYIVEWIDPLGWKFWLLHVPVVLLVLMFCFPPRFGIQNRLYAPGPLGLPVVGHLHLLGKEPYAKLLNWKKIYGPIIFIRLGSFPAIVINDLKLIKEAFSRPEFAGRPMFKATAAANNHQGLVFGDGLLVQEQRRLVLKQLKDVGNKSVDQKSHQGVQALLMELVENSRSDQPISLEGRFDAHILSTLWNIFKNRNLPAEDPKIQRLVDAIKSVKNLDGLLPKMSVFMPWLSRLLPNASGYKKQLAGFTTVYKFMEAELNEPSGQMPGQPGNFKDADQPEVNKNNPGSDKIFRTTLGDFFIASLETTVATLNWFVIYMARHQQVQQELFKEIRDKIGTFRLPSLTDRPNCPFAEATLYEVLRLSAVVPLGMYHRALEDVEFNGFFVPKDTLVIGNAYAVLHNPSSWTDPFTFYPARFLDNRGRIVSSKTDKVISFSVGERSCIGEGVAKDILFLYMTSLVQRFQIECAADQSPSMNGIPGDLIKPKPYKVVFTDRLQRN